MEILNNFISIYCFIAFVLGVVFTFTALTIAAMNKVKEQSNKVHFYVARDEDDTLYLYMSKPIRYSSYFWPDINGQSIASGTYFESFNLNVDDFKDLKWKDEPAEVFLNLKD